ncbi:MAG TPA: YkgJ family cysteine cluster protein [Methanomicrobiales archaeon]|jgi:Fe-S-cluster containining protein|nr:YkgJ family cysteine cluster protein [Methanomicrobiales archaeon]
MDPTLQDLAAEIQAIGFSCRRCGACCRPGEEDSGLVFASHDEVEVLVASGAGSWDEVAAPYPDFIPCGNGSMVTLGWCLRREGGRCRFLGDRGCTRYPERPWICRTYPFALVDGGLSVSDCSGLGVAISREDALLLAEKLLERARSEEDDEERVRRAYACARVPAGKRCVVDSAGLRILED